jgi:type IV pilus assembly protein PilV
MKKNSLTVPRSGALRAAGLRVAGLTLIETLVALVILSVGLLGIAALHVESVKSARSAMLRTKAVALASDMAEKMRANRAAAVAGQYIIGEGDAGTNRNCADDDDGVATVACTPLQMAEHDIWLWKRRIANPQSGLPGDAVATIASDGAPVPTFTITIAWEETDAAQAIALQVQP